mmetsp:Transcript_36777/g.118319  ORF Transcript_36777/g.118319 Transcript_36777/m.118319 type:complete len:230 (-) Transcript_36777:41-730(-)
MRRLAQLHGHSVRPGMRRIERLEQVQVVNCVAADRFPLLDHGVIHVLDLHIGLFAEDQPNAPIILPLIKVDDGILAPGSLSIVVGMLNLVFSVQLALENVWRRRRPGIHLDAVYLRLCVERARADQRDFAVGVVVSPGLQLQRVLRRFEHRRPVQVHQLDVAVRGRPGDCKLHERHKIGNLDDVVKMLVHDAVLVARVGARLSRCHPDARRVRVETACRERSDQRCQRY